MGNGKSKSLFESSKHTLKKSPLSDELNHLCLKGAQRVTLTICHLRLVNRTFFEKLKICPIKELIMVYFCCRRIKLWQNYTNVKSICLELEASKINAIKEAAYIKERFPEYQGIIESKIYDIETSLVY